MHIDFKVTIWDRVTIPKEMEKELVRKIKNGTITSVEDIYTTFPNNEDYTHELLHDTDEQMFPAENEGCATIEVHEAEGNSNPIWDNGDKE